MVRRLVIMGSGETTPGMLGVHRRVFAGLPDPARARLLDSPFAFQENADELVQRIGAYFAESVGRPLTPIRLSAAADPLAIERAVAQIRSADWVFAGPGSPSYARRCWVGTGVPAALAEVISDGRSGALVLASAAAVTLGDWALPVYEVYKVGEDPRWEPGIGLMQALLGWRCAVVPHYDNQEGGTHDTRYCYLGARRLAVIEPDLAGAFILGVDEHTALLLDLTAGTAEVAGRGGVTIRVAGVEEVVPSGTTLPIADLERLVARLGAAGAVGAIPDGSTGPAPVPVPDAVDRDWATGSAVPRPGDPEALARTILAALPDSERDARDCLMALVERAEDASAAASREAAQHLVEALVDLRSQVRAAGDWAASDRLRDVLAQAGIEVRDTRSGSTWEWR
jgi:hypothetical protein